jgi:hypothetical protein
VIGVRGPSAGRAGAATLQPGIATTLGLTPEDTILLPDVESAA